MDLGAHLPLMDFGGDQRARNDWFHITDEKSEAEQVMRDRVLPTIHRPEEILRERLPVGPAEVFAEKLSAFARAGVQRVFLCPLPTRRTSWSCSGKRSGRRSPNEWQTSVWS